MENEGKKVAALPLKNGLQEGKIMAPQPLKNDHDDNNNNKVEPTKIDSVDALPLSEAQCDAIVMENASKANISAKKNKQSQV